MADETEIKFRFTPKGQQISAAILGGKDKIEFTKAATSIDVHINDTDTDVANIIDLDNKKQIVDISGTVAVNNNVVQIPIKFEKNKIAEDYQMNTIGIYAKYQGQEFLYAFGALKYPLYMHHTDDSGVFKMYTYITVGTVANVVIKTDNTESVSHDELARELQKYRDELKSLDPLNSPDGNNIYDTIIDLDSYSTVGITKFLNCQLKSTGAMSGFDQATDKLYGWIFNVPKWNGASELQQIVYICNYGQGTLTYARSRVNGEGTNVENFEKILTDKDLKVYADGVKDQIKNAGNVKSATINGSSVVTPDEQGNLPLKVDAYTKDESDKTFVKTVDGLKLDSNGNVQTDHYSKVEVDKFKNDLLSRIEAQENRELIHDAADYDTGLAYSKAHPHVLVATP